MFSRWSHSRETLTNRQSFNADTAQAEVLVTTANRRVFWFLCAFCSGLVTIGMQIIWSRLLAMIIGSSTYAFALVLALFLLGLALGAWVVSFTVTSDSNRLRRDVFVVQLFTVVALFMS